MLPLKSIGSLRRRTQDHRKKFRSSHRREREEEARSRLVHIVIFFIFQPFFFCFFVLDQNALVEIHVVSRIFDFDS